MISNPENLHERRKALKRHILSGGTLKEFAYIHNISSSLASKMAAECGFRKYFLLEDEAKQLAAQRKQRLSA